MWRVNPFWLTLLPTSDPIPGDLREFLIFNKHSGSGEVVWYSIKAFLRGLLIREISGIKRRSREWEDTVHLELQTREMALVADPTPANQNSWKEAQSLYNKVVLSTTEKKRYFLQQNYFEEGENTGHLLAMVAKAQQESTSITEIKNPNGEISTSTIDILDTFQQFYADLYTSKTNNTLSDLALFLGDCTFPFSR